jgi:hypothetical protein
MKSKTLTGITAIVLFAALAIPLRLAAPDKPNYHQTLSTWAHSTAPEFRLWRIKSQEPLQLPSGCRRSRTSDSNRTTLTSVLLFYGECADRIIPRPGREPPRHHQPEVSIRPGGTLR